MPHSVSKLLLVTRNAFKLKEAAALCGPHNIIIESFDKKIEELQTDDSKRLVEEKMLTAFRDLKRPLLVEHTGLKIHKFGNMPAGLTQLFWDKLGADGLCHYFPDHSVTAFTIIGYCDGRRMHQFHGEVEGLIVSKPRGNLDFQWDAVFQPSGLTKTFGEMTLEEKNKDSMRSRAFLKFIAHVKKHH